MAIRISEITKAPERDIGSLALKTEGNKITCRRIFKVEGDLHVKEIELLENLCKDVYQSGCLVGIELANLCFVDVESARVLCRMRQQWDIEIKGMNLFIKKIMDLAEDSEITNNR